MATVKDWAGRTGADYQFIDDRLFDYTPKWYRDKVDNDIWLVTDLARLELAKELLRKYDRTIWVDADILVFDPENFTIDITEGFAFCREVWLTETPWPEKLVGSIKRSIRGPSGKRGRVNNSISVFVRDNTMLDFLISASTAIVREARGSIPSAGIGTDFLTHLNRTCHFPLLPDAGLFSPAVMGNIAAGRGPLLRRQAREYGHPVHAANLCGSSARNGSLEEPDFEKVIRNLLDSRGSLINDHVPGFAAV